MNPPLIVYTLDISAISTIQYVLGKSYKKVTMTDKILIYGAGEDSSNITSDAIKAGFFPYFWIWPEGLVGIFFF